MMKKEYVTPSVQFSEIDESLAILDGAATGGTETPGGSHDYEKQEEETLGVKGQSVNVWEEW